MAGSFPWYYVPLVPALTVILGLGVQLLIRIPDVVQRLNDKSQSRLKNAILVTSAVVLMGSSLIYWVQDARTDRSLPADGRYIVYHEASDWLVKNAAPRDTLACYEIGYMGYFTNMKIIDILSLVTPPLLPWASEGSVGLFRHMLMQYTPTYILLMKNVDSQQIEILNQDKRYEYIKTFNNTHVLYRIIQ
jgi:hypothetical protein